MLALAEPVIYRVRPVFKRNRVDIAVGIDISKSMLAEDAAFPKTSKNYSLLQNRLNRARIMVLDLLDNLQGEKIEVFVFVATAYELVPLTNDYGYCRYLVENIIKELDLAGFSKVDESQPCTLSPWLLLAAFTVFLVAVVNRQN